MAVWVEGASGNFVKSLKVRAEKRKQYLFTWNSKSLGNVTDAITGAKLSSHERHQVAWDITNTSGVIVPNGNYKIVVEYTSEHAQGPLLNINFTVGNSDLAMTPADETYFKDITLIYQAISCPSIRSITYDPTCHGKTDGAIQLSIQSNGSAYSILWSTGDTTRILEGLTSGEYTATISGQNGCLTSETFILTDPHELTVNNTFTENTCAGDSSASIVVNALGGTPPYYL